MSMISLGKNLYPVTLKLMWHEKPPHHKQRRWDWKFIDLRAANGQTREDAESWRLWLYWPSGAVGVDLYIDRRPREKLHEPKLVKALRLLIDYYDWREVNDALKVLRP